MKSKVVQYIKDYDIEEGIVIPVQGYKSVVCNHTRRYHNCLYLLAGLGTCSRNLMDYLVEYMDGNNIVYSNKYVKEKFINFIYEASNNEIRYGDSSVKKAFTTLASKGLLRKVGRGVYKVNPEYFSKNTDKNREYLIKVELEFTADLDTKLKITKSKEKICLKKE